MIQGAQKLTLSFYQKNQKFDDKNYLHIILFDSKNSLPSEKAHAEKADTKRFLSDFEKNLTTKKHFVLLLTTTKESSSFLWLSSPGWATKK